jgi:hypothetical protein
VPVRADLTIVVDVATRTICAAVLRPVGTKAVDAALLLARMLVPEPMRPGWSAAVRMSASRLPHARLVDIDTRMELAAARPVIVPDTIVIDGGKVFVSDTFTRACDRLGVSVQRARPRTPTDKAIVEATFGSINTLFCQHVAAYTGSNTTLCGLDATGAWTLPELQDLLDEWLLVGWQPRPHDAPRDPMLPRRALSPNEMYAALVAAAGYLPLTLSGEDYLELLPVEWRQINAYGIRIDYRTYGCVELGPWRLQHSGVTARRGLWEVHYDPYDAPHVFVRTPDGWVTVPWTHLPLVSAPFAEFTWRHARTLAAEKGLDDTNETEVARVLDDLLTRAQAGPVSKLSDRIAARTRVAGAAHRPPPREAGVLRLHPAHLLALRRSAAAGLRRSRRRGRDRSPGERRMGGDRVPVLAARVGLAVDPDIECFGNVPFAGQHDGGAVPVVVDLLDVQQGFATPHAEHFRGLAGAGDGAQRRRRVVCCMP